MVAACLKELRAVSYERAEGDLLRARCSTLTATAQVGEWLKPADCKSAPPRRYEGSNPSLCTRFWRGTGRLSFGKKISSSAGSIRGFGGISICNFAGPESARRDFGNPGAICGEDLGAAKRCDASGGRRCRDVACQVCCSCSA